MRVFVRLRENVFGWDDGFMAGGLVRLVFPRRPARLLLSPKKVSTEGSNETLDPIPCGRGPRLRWRLPWTRQI
jgi:hypothetical protein